MPGIRIGAGVAFAKSRMVGTPLQRFIDDGGLFWIDPTDATDDGGVSFIPDATGNGNDFSQATAADRLAITTINGAVALQGADGDNIERANGALLQAQPYTLYFAFQTPASPGSGFRYLVDSWATLSDLVLDPSRKVAFTAGTLLTTAGAVANSQSALVRVVANGASTKITVWRNGGTTLETVGNAGIGDINGMNIMGRGTADSFLGKGGICALKAGDYSSSDAYLTSYLLNLYGIIPS